MGRSSAFWRGNLYTDPERSPRPDAPAHDLPPLAAAIFTQVRDGLVALPALRERVRHHGPAWQWAWEYRAGGRPVCWLHVMETGLSGTFTVSRHELADLEAVIARGPDLARAVRTGQQTGPVRWCWMELDARDKADQFLAFTRERAGLIERSGRVSVVYRHRAG